MIEHLGRGCVFGLYVNSRVYVNVYRSENLMDHMMKHIEQHATTLEKKSTELQEERHRAELLLYRMLPR